MKSITNEQKSKYHDQLIKAHNIISRVYDKLYNTDYDEHQVTRLLLANTDILLIACDLLDSKK